MGAGDQMRHPGLAAALVGLAGLAACAPAPIPVEEAEQRCASEVRAYTLRPQPRLSMGVGIGSGGHVSPHAGLSVSMTPERASALDTAAAFNRCVMQRSGRMPRYPLAGYPAPQG